ncbi:hypothetical protein PanWU01x14_164140 [Parasponia andersonii]|uniref:Uncharacterized protein n=1 Tax=Parasponia andersonii TaxID=3476 RepID=A0A2P5CCV7_PARAD|nr:hypothetical protein PanWU01x14_164140 [Parasponia andersonii]
MHMKFWIQDGVVESVASPGVVNLTSFSGRAKKEAKDSSLIKAILKSNAYEVLDPGWGSRISHLTTGSENDIFQDLFGPRNSPESRHYSMLLLKLFLIACKHCGGEYWVMQYINRPAFWRKTRNRPAFWRKTRNRISSE